MMASLQALMLLAISAAIQLCCCGEDDDVRLKVFRDCKLTSFAVNPIESDPSAGPVPATTKFQFHTLIGVDDPSEQVTFLGTFFFALDIKCIAERSRFYQNASYTVLDMWVITNVDQYWKPPVFHMNSRKDVGLRDDIFPTITVYPLNGIVTFTYFGSYTMSCPLNLRA